MDQASLETTGNRLAAWVAIASLLIGLIANILFFGQDMGINFTLFIMSLVAGALILLAVADVDFNWLHVVFAIPALIFATFLSVRANEPLSFFNMLWLVVTLFIAIRFAQVQAFLGGHWRYVFLAVVQTIMLSWIEAPIYVLSRTTKHLGSWQPDQEHAPRWRAFARGFAITVPVLLVFGALLGSADLVFGRVFTDLIGWLIPTNMNEVVGRLMLTLFFGWLAMTAYRGMLFPPGKNAIDDWQRDLATDQEAEAAPGMRLGMIEATMLLGSLNMMFLFFILLQFQYLFGGETNISARGLTYAEYARRGFFEILTVSLLTFGLIILMRYITKRTGDQEEKRFNLLGGGMIGLTIILLVAAFQRLAIYVDAYGYTRLRIQTQVFIIFLAIVLIVLLLDLFRRTNFVWKAVLLGSIGYMVILNLMNIDRFIAEYNIERWEQTGKIDIGYLVYDLSDDAVPATVTLLDEPELEVDDLEMLKTALGYRLQALRLNEEDNSWLSYHYGHSKALDALETYASILDDYIELR